LINLSKEETMDLSNEAMQRLLDSGHAMGVEPDLIRELRSARLQVEHLNLANKSLMGDVLTLRAEVNMVGRKYTVLLGEKLEADDKASNAHLQIDEMKKVIRDAHLSGYSRGLGPCVCKWCVETTKPEKPKSENDHAHTCTGSSRDCPHCGCCPECGGKQIGVLPGMERSLAEKAHQTEQAAHQPKGCDHGPESICPKCDLI
jgi:hypothetical protein